MSALETVMDYILHAEHLTLLVTPHLEIAVEFEPDDRYISAVPLHLAIEECRLDLVMLITKIWRMKRSYDQDEEKILQRLELPYRDYLKTSHWKQLRETMLVKCRNRCQLCNTDGPVHVHHRTYDRRGFEHLADLVVLCAACHAKFHNKLPKHRE